MKVENYPEFLRLYEESFPADERRVYWDENDFARFADANRGLFHAVCAIAGNEFCGFLTYWTFAGYLYVEHFAILPECRGMGIGSRMLRNLFETVGEDVLIEVEHPDTDDARRRIRFYERAGFRVRDEFEYVQPPYSDGLSPVPLLLMTHGNVRLESKSDISELLRYVYGVDAGLSRRSF